MSRKAITDPRYPVDALQSRDFLFPSKTESFICSRFSLFTCAALGIQHDAFDFFSCRTSHIQPIKNEFKRRNRTFRVFSPLLRIGDCVIYTPRIVICTRVLFQSRWNFVVVVTLVDSRRDSYRTILLANLSDSLEDTVRFRFAPNCKLRVLILSVTGRSVKTPKVFLVTQRLPFHLQPTDLRRRNNQRRGRSHSLRRSDAALIQEHSEHEIHLAPTCLHTTHKQMMGASIPMKLFHRRTTFWHWQCTDSHILLPRF